MKPDDPTYHVKALARELAEHYVEMSRFGRPERRALGSVSSNASKLPSRRIVAVVGAGASADAGLLGGPDAITRISKSIFAGDDRPEEPEAPKEPRRKEAEGEALKSDAWQRYRQELLRLQSVYRLVPTEFETALLAMASIGYADRLRRTLEKMYSRSCGTLLQYEILAHLLKHHFLDAIINFNFDELLDRAIEDELRPDEYHRVLSDGDCPNEHDEDDGTPIYVKPHGTVSHPSTLRFTREAYFGLPLGIHRLLEQLVCDKPITLLVIGFNMQSFEFNLLLHNAHAGTRVYHVNLAKPVADPPLPPQISEVCIEVSKRSSGAANERSVPTLDVRLGDLWKEVETALNGNAAGKHGKNAFTRGIDRHRLVASLFHASEFKPTDTRPGEPTRTKTSDYLRDRCVVELALSVAKTKGLVSISGLTTDRCGQYYERLQRELRRELQQERKEEQRRRESETPALQSPTPAGQSARSDSGGGPHESDDRTLLALCLEIGLREKSYGRQALRFEPDTPYGLGSRAVAAATDFEVVREMDRKRLFLNVCSMVTPETNARLKACERTFLDTLLMLDESQEIEIRAALSAADRAIFINPTVIRTVRHLRDETTSLLANKDWNLLLVSAETGEWLKDPEITEIIGRAKDRRLAFVVADRTFEDDLVQMYPGRIVEFVQMNPWEHNRHMTIAIRGEYEPVGSIYFDRPRRASDVTPLRLDAVDSQVPLEIFAAYRTKATDHQASGRPLVPSEYDAATLIDQLRKNPPLVSRALGV